MNKEKLQSIYPNEEDSRVANIIIKILLVLSAAYLIAVVVGSILGDRKLVITSAITIFMLLIPWALLMKTHVRASGNFLMMIVLISTTIFATNGQGYHDIVILAYPIIIVLASLLVPRNDFFWISFATILSIAWLVFGEALGLFIPAINSSPPTADFILITVILLVAVFGVDILAENMRRNTHIALQEISNRKSIESELRFQSIHDPLTGIYNRAFFNEAMERMEREQEYPVSIIVMDVDRLKHLNDTRGHIVGDEHLCSIANLLSSLFRNDDVVARIGGDEFAILLPRTNPETVIQVADRILTHIYEHNRSNPDKIIQLSIGYTTSVQGELKEAFHMADQGMYTDKLERRKGKIIS